MRLFRRKPKCPNCGKALEDAPKRKTKCPHCGQYILVRKGELVTEEEASIRDWLARLGGLGVTRQDFERARGKLSKQFGFRAGVNDTVWRILNSMVGQPQSQPVLKSVYLEMAHLAELEGKDPKPYLTQAHEGEMSQHQESRAVRMVEFRTANDNFVCANCRALERKRFPVDEAPVLPYERCTSKEGCRCWTAPVVKPQ